MTGERFPVVMEYVTVSLASNHENVCLLPEAAAVLAARGASEILFPVPSKQEEILVKDALRFLPRGERTRVRLVDQDGRVLRLVRSYLEPLKENGGKFYGGDATADLPYYAEAFLYQILLAWKHKAGIADKDLHRLRLMALRVDPTRYSVLGRLRFAEILNLMNSYRPSSNPLGFLHENAGNGVGADLWKLIRTATFNDVVRANGAVGYAKHPIVALRQAGVTMGEFFGKRPAKMLLNAGRAAAEVATKLPIPDFFDSKGGKKFSPSFLDIAPAMEGISKLSLKLTYGQEVKPDERIFLNRSRDGWIEHSWIDPGNQLATERLSQPHMPQLVRAPTMRARADTAASCRMLATNLFAN